MRQKDCSQKGTGSQLALPAFLNPVIENYSQSQKARRMHAPHPARLTLALAPSLFLACAAPAKAEPPALQLVIQGHKFQPALLHLPADTKVAIHVHNADPTPEEFESSDLNREKIVQPGADITVFVGPLSPGSYGFFGDFHPDLAQGRILVP